jgi:DNA mismatch endonuclease (patch repair protein)
MKGNKSRDTRPELQLRRSVHRRGLRYRLGVTVTVEGLKVRPDLTFKSDRVAVFVDGCFWHACPDHGRRPRKNSEYWGPKLDRNVARDRLVDTALTAAGWVVLRVWEHEDAEEAGIRVARVVTARGGKRRGFRRKQREDLPHLAEARSLSLGAKGV